MRASLIAGSLLGVLLIPSCTTPSLSPVRTTLFQTTSQKAEPSAQTYERFQDTLYLTPTELSPTDFEPLFTQALQLFQRGEYTHARSLLMQLVYTPSVPDSLAREALFLSAECSAALGELSTAQSSYEHLLRQTQLHVGLRERTLLRLGHVLCAQGFPEQAAQFFAELQRQFPRSRYLPLARCTAINSPNVPGPAALPKFAPR